MAYATFGACITMCTIHPQNANYLIHCKSVTACPNVNVTTCPNVISITTFVIVKNAACLHLATYIQGSLYSHNHEHVYIHIIY